MLIGLNGRLNSGKDTVYKILKEELGAAYNVERVAFADKLKESAAAALGMSVDLVEYLKNKEDWHYRPDDGSWRPYGYARPFNMRTFLQRYGTEAHRDIFGQDFWIDAALPRDFSHAGRTVIVTDMRFPNEQDRVRALGGYCALITRPEREGVAGNHPSEQTLTCFDWTIRNTGDLEELKEKVMEMWGSLIFNKSVFDKP